MNANAQFFRALYSGIRLVEVFFLAGRLRPFASPLFSETNAMPDWAFMQMYVYAVTLA
jgi:hypothetical protein